jgi:hypothetical protein
LPVDDDQTAAVSPNAAQDQPFTDGVLIKKWEELS